MVHVTCLWWWQHVVQTHCHPFWCPSFGLHSPCEFSPPNSEIPLPFLFFILYAHPPSLLQWSQHTPISTSPTIPSNMAAVHSPSITAHPAGFQTHNMPGSRIGIHPALAQPTVSPNNIALSSQYSTNIYSGSPATWTTGSSMGRIQTWSLLAILYHHLAQSPLHLPLSNSSHCRGKLDWLHVSNTSTVYSYPHDILMVELGQIIEGNASGLCVG